MLFLILVFFVSFISCLLLIVFSKRNGLFIDRGNSNKPQRFHTNDTPRIGGIGIVVAFTIGTLLFGDSLAWKLLLAFLPVGLAGFLEDISISINPKVRLLVAFLSALLTILLTGIFLKGLGMPLLNNLPAILGIVFTVFAVAGVTNSINIIDGFNGLASGFSLIALVVFAVVSYQLHDKVLFEISLTLFFSAFGFFILNFPLGKIFLGDSGAYFLGFMLAELSVFLVSRHPRISPWFCLAIMIYPVWEVLFSFYRRRFLRGMPAMYPDRMHFHSIVFRRLTKSNSKTSLLILSFVIPYEFTLYFFKNRSSISMLFILFFIVAYDTFYYVLVWYRGKK